MDAKDLLIADLEHFGESAWRNEEVGEKRFSFFVALSTAVVAGLVALATSETPPSKEELRAIATAAVGVLLVVGVLSQLRLLHRNRITDEYHRTLTYIRNTYTAACPALQGYKVPRRRDTWAGQWLKGGYVETMGTINGMILIAFLMLAFDASLMAAAGVALVLVAGTWVAACRRDKSIEAEAAVPVRYRAGVGAVIANDAGGVLALERSDVPGAWQFPQGGLEAGEDPLTAVFREIQEETGIVQEQLELVARYPQPLAYELPPQHRSAKTGLGQVQYWFLFRFRGTDADIRPPRGGEFRRWSWRPFDSVVAGAAEFRRHLYEVLEAFFARYFDRPR